LGYSDSPKPVNTPRRQHSKWVAQIDRITGATVQTFKSIRAAARNCKATRDQVVAACQNSRVSLGGFFWKMVTPGMAA